jgi:putative oxidoreductase
MEKLIKFYSTATNWLYSYLFPVLLLAMRVWMARVFFYSGLSKIATWQSTIYLFAHEYQVPVISPEIAAYLATSFELVCPVLLVVGIATRFATLPMLGMTAVIQFTYLDSTDHYYWAMVLGTILCTGAGKISLDWFIKSKLYNLFVSDHNEQEEK